MRSSSTVISSLLNYILSMLAWRVLFQILKLQDLLELERLLTANGKDCVISLYGTNPQLGSGLMSL
eukprot:11532798-Heterocapsa_arctica.AAC.1